MAINVKMGVSGVNEIKKAMSETQAAAKTLGSQMKLNEAQYKQTGNAENYLAQKGKLLQQSIEKQQQIAKQATQALQAMQKNGIEPTSKAYQEMERRMLDAQTAMTGMQTELDNLGKSSEGAAQKTDALAQSVNGISKKISLKMLQDGLESINGWMDKGIQKARELGSAIWENITDAARYSDDLVTQASILNMDVEDYEKYKKVFDTIGEITVQEWVKLRGKMEAALVSPSGEQLDIFSMLGLTSEVSGKYGSEVRLLADNWEDLFWQAGEALRKKVASKELTQDQADVYANALFGKNFGSFNSLLKLGQEGFNEAVNDQTAATAKARENLAELNDKLIALQGNFETLKTEVMGELAPALTKAADAINKMLVSVTEYLQTEEGKEKLEALGETLSQLFEKMINFDPDTAVNAVATALDTLKQGLEFIKNNWSQVKDGIEMIVGAFVATNATIAGLKIWSLIQGIQGVGMSGVATAGAAAGTSWGAAFGAAVLKAAPWLAGLYVGLNPGNTAGDAEDKAAARKMRNYMEAMDAFDIRTVMDLMEYDNYFQSLMEQEYKTPEHLIRQLETAYGLKRVEGGTGVRAALGDETGLMPYFTTVEEVNKALDEVGYADVKKFEDSIEALRTWFDVLKNAGPGGTVELGGQQVSVEELWAKSTEDILAQYMHSSLASMIVKQMREHGYSEADYDEMIKNMMRHRPQLKTFTELMQEAGGGVPIVEVEPEMAEGWHSELQEEVSKKPLIATVAVQMRGFWGGGAGAGGSHGTVMQVHANGLPYVPFDGYMAMLHKGERVLTARENRSYTTNSNLYVERMIMNNGQDADALAGAIAARNKAVARGYGQ